MKINNLRMSRAGNYLMWNNIQLPMFTQEEAEKLVKENAPTTVTDSPEDTDE